MAARAIAPRMCEPLLPASVRRALRSKVYSLVSLQSSSLRSPFIGALENVSQLGTRIMPSAHSAGASVAMATASATSSFSAILPALGAVQALGVVHHISASAKPSFTVTPFSKKQQLELPFALRALHSVAQSQAPAAVAGKDSSVVVELQECERVQGEGVNGQPGKYWRISSKKLYREDGTEWPWHSFTPAESYSANTQVDLHQHFAPANFGDVFAKYLVKSLRVPADLFFQRRYGCRAMMLETVAAVPGMVAGALLHLKCLRLIEHSGGWIKALLEEAENERMHLMAFMEVSQPKWYERALIFGVQGVFCAFYGTAYVLSPRVAHRIVGFLEEEAVHSYTEFLNDIDAGKIENVPAPQIAIDYWRLPKEATLRDVVVVVRADEAHHRDVNHFAASIIQKGDHLKDNPAPLNYH